MINSVLRIIRVIGLITIKSLIQKNNSLQISKQYLNLPISAYIIDNVNMNVNGKPINSWITEENIRTIFKNINIFFNKYGVNWDLKEIIAYKVHPSFYENTTFINIYTGKPYTNTPKNFLETLVRPPDNIEARLLDKSNRQHAYSYLIPATKYNLNNLNIYFNVFNGNRRQGLANINSNNHLTRRDGNGSLGVNIPDYITFTFIGTWTNKYSGINTPPIKRDIYGSDGNPSLSFTVAHELSHVLGLSHLNTSSNNIMNSRTSSFVITPNQEITIKKTATEILVKLSQNATIVMDNIYD